MQAAIDEVVAYSTSEVVVGTWVDGSLIYRKCYDGSGSYTSAVTLDSLLTSSNIRLIKCLGSTLHDSVYNSPFYNIGSQEADVFVSSSGVLLQIVGTTVQKYSVIIEYIKLS